MAVAAPVRFCGRCGAPLAPGAPFCGRCGAPVAQGALAQPVYRYPSPPAGYAPPRPTTRLAPALVAGGLIVVLIVAAVVVAGVLLARVAGGGHTPCTSNCGPKLVTPLPEEASFRSSTYNFQVNYSKAWTVRSQDAASVSLGTRAGIVEVAGTKGVSPDQEIATVIADLPSSTWQDVQVVSTLKGAHIGDQDGIGRIYSANLVGNSQTATKVRFAVVAAEKNGVTVVVFAADPADTKNSPNGIPEAQDFDYLCTEFDWSPT
jgi:zinc-ribbon domain